MALAKTPHAPALAAVILLAGFGARAADASSEPVYEATVASDLGTMDIHVRFASPSPAALTAADVEAAVYLRRVTINGSLVPLPTAGVARIESAVAPAAYDLRYSVDLRAMARTRQFPHVDAPAARAVLIDPAAWLWLPEQGQGGRLRFHLPPGVSVSSAWPQSVEGSGSGDFEIDTTPREWSALMAIGRFQVERIAVPGASLRLAILDGVPHPDREALRDWVRDGAEAVAGLYGAFPAPAPQVLVVPSGHGDEVVPWGQVLRGGGPGAQLFVDQTKAPRDFAEDWVLVHELSHLFLPRLDAEGEWFAEGIATYYQNVLRARAGLLTEAQAWQELQQGFQRGFAQTQGAVTLRDATRDMKSRHLFMRVYWSGAAIVLLGDLAMRRHGASLDLALSRLRACCLGETREWPLAELLETLDHLAGVPAFLPLYHRYMDSDRFPDLSQAYAQLGLDSRNGTPGFSNAAPAAALRRAIMGPASDGPG